MAWSIQELANLRKEAQWGIKQILFSHKGVKLCSISSSKCYGYTHYQCTVHSMEYLSSIGNGCAFPELVAYFINYVSSHNSVFALAARETN